ncbi:GNAT family N-acetyltransferase [Streptomyces sp. NPDC005573]|uniref:GNAT family N-acetyltransferase n=1 Tax=unclassified Streptomyces TaxID=2593676 RepID=UPI0033A3936A
MILRSAREDDIDALVGLAAEVEQWFGPMAGEPGFHRVLERHVRRSTALVASSPSGLLGGLLFGAGHAPVHHIHWLVVSAEARRRGVGRALVNSATRRFVRGPGTIEVVTFGPDHPGAAAGGGRVFYERLGFSPAEAAAPGPEGGSRQVYRLAVD